MNRFFSLPERREKLDKKVDLVVIGAGLPKTGTSSLRAAFDILYPGYCYHMNDVFQGPPSEAPFWKSVLEADFEQRPRMLRTFFEAKGCYSAAVDNPVSRFYKELMLAFPEAKVVLSVRNPISWYESVRDSIYVTKLSLQDFAVRSFLRLKGDLEMLETAVKITEPVYEAIEKGPSGAEEYFNTWIKEVKEHVPEDQLLIFEVKQGWKPLCEFLGLKVPDEEFPYVNDKATAQSRPRNMKILSYVVIYVLIPLVGLFAWTLLNKLSYK